MVLLWQDVLVFYVLALWYVHSYDTALDVQRRLLLVSIFTTALGAALCAPVT